MARVYVETSFASFCVTARDDAASIYRRQVSEDWWDSQRSKHVLFVSEEVLEELSHPEFARHDAALQMLSEVPVLPTTEEVRGLARILVRDKVMPQPIAGDAIHVAVATVYGMDYMLTWNVRHLANVNKAEHLTVICRRVGYVPPRILTPDLLWEYEA